MQTFHGMGARFKIHEEKGLTFGTERHIQKCCVQARVNICALYSFFQLAEVTSKHLLWPQGSSS